MASLFTIDIYCADCRYRAFETIDREDKEDSWNWAWSCPNCGQSMQRVIGAPRVLKASFLDGQRKEFTDLKEAARLESEMYDLPVEKRAGIRKAIRELKRVR